MQLAIDLLRDAGWVTRKRVMRWGTGFALLSVLVLGWDALLHTRQGLTDAVGIHIGRDFVNYWAGARLVASRVRVSQEPSNPMGQGGDRLQDVLAVVERQQQPAAGQHVK